MATINTLMFDLDERTIAQRIAIRHDEARMQYYLRSNTVADFHQFKAIIADYYNHHYTRCVSHGGMLAPSEAYGRTKELIENEYRKKRRGDIVMAFNDCADGTRLLSLDFYIWDRPWRHKGDIVSPTKATCDIHSPGAAG